MPIQAALSKYYQYQELTLYSTTAESVESGRVRISVVDQGIGIPAAAHPKIFGIVERGILPDSYEGTGMGLAIVARAVQRMGGTCGVESEPGKGSHFWIELPAADLR